MPPDYDQVTSSKGLDSNSLPFRMKAQIAEVKFDSLGEITATCVGSSKRACESPAPLSASTDKEDKEERMMEMSAPILESSGDSAPAFGTRSSRRWYHGSIVGCMVVISDDSIEHHGHSITGGLTANVFYTIDGQLVTATPVRVPFVRGSGIVPYLGTLLKGRGSK